MSLIVTGGGGFVGKALCTALREKGHNVISLSRKPYPELSKLGVKAIQIDLSEEKDRLVEVFRGAHTVFHTAAKVDLWGDQKEFYRHNVKATENVIKACRHAQVKQLIYTSSPSVIHTGCHLRGINEDVPYPKRYHSYYPETKALAEKAILAANSEELYTLSLRPHLIWGPGDRHLIPSLTQKAKEGRLIRIGNGKNLIDTCYIEDCVQAHLQAYHALTSKPESRGKAYFISQGDPISLWDFVDQILSLYQIPPLKRALPYPIAKACAFILEWVSKCLPRQPEPILTRFLASELAKDHYFDLSRAKNLLDYKPSYNMKEALIHYKNWLKKPALVKQEN